MNKTKFRDLPVGANFRFNGELFTCQKTSGSQTATVNYFNLDTLSHGWTPANTAVWRIVTPEVQLSLFPPSLTN